MKRILLSTVVVIFMVSGNVSGQDKTLKASIESGQQVYAENCMSCHMENGEGVEGTFPPLVKSEFVTGDAKRLISIILNGQTGEITVNGKTYNMDMPAQGHLSDEEVANVANYIRNSWGNASKKAVAAADVSKLRQ